MRNEKAVWSHRERDIAKHRGSRPAGPVRYLSMDEQDAYEAELLARNAARKARSPVNGGPPKGHGPPPKPR